MLFIFEKRGKKKVNYREMEVETVKRRECLPRITTKAGRNGPTKRIGKQKNNNCSSSNNNNAEKKQKLPTPRRPKR